MSITRYHASRRSSLILAALWFAGVIPLLASCHGNKPEPEQRETKLLVFAATSLRDAFGQLADAFKKSHPGVEVTFNFAGTQEIRTQLEQGAEADVFASADERHMKALQDAGKVEAPRVFAENEPVIVVATEKVGSVRTLASGRSQLASAAPAAFARSRICRRPLAS